MRLCFFKQGIWWLRSHLLGFCQRTERLEWGNDSKQGHYQGCQVDPSNLWFILQHRHEKEWGHCWSGLKTLLQCATQILGRSGKANLHSTYFVTNLLNRKYTRWLVLFIDIENHIVKLTIFLYIVYLAVLLTRVIVILSSVYCLQHHLSCQTLNF